MAGSCIKLLSPENRCWNFDENVVGAFVNTSTETTYALKLWLRPNGPQVANIICKVIYFIR